MLLMQLVDGYFRHRGLVKPNSSQALLFLISELGELADAYGKNWPNLSDDTIVLLREMADLGASADMLVSDQAAWVRNQDRVNAVSERFEIGDVLMMLTCFSLAIGQGDPIACMLDKFRAKGFDAGVYLVSKTYKP